MRILRTALTASAFCLLCAGYAASQVAYFNGTYVTYYSNVDSQPIHQLAGILLLSAVILAFIREKPEEASKP